MMIFGLILGSMSIYTFIFYGIKGRINKISKFTSMLSQICYLGCIITFFISIIYAQINVINIVLILWFIAIFMYGFSKIIMYFFFLHRLNLAFKDTIFQINKIMYIILLMVLIFSLLLVVVIAYLALRNEIGNYWIFINMLYMVALLYDIMLICLFQKKLFSLIHLKGRNSVLNNKQLISKQDSKFIDIMIRMIVLGSIANTSSLLSIMITFIRFFDRKRYFLYIHITITCWDGLLCLLCLFLNFAYNQKYYYKLCTFIHWRCNDLCSWWIIKNLKAKYRSQSRSISLKTSNTIGSLKDHSHSFRIRYNNQKSSEIRSLKNVELRSIKKEDQLLKEASHNIKNHYYDHNYNNIADIDPNLSCCFVCYECICERCCLYGLSRSMSNDEIIVIRLNNHTKPHDINRSLDDDIVSLVSSTVETLKKNMLLHNYNDTSINDIDSDKNYQILTDKTHLNDNIYHESHAIV